MTRITLFLIAILSVITVAACQRAEQKTAASAEAKRYDLTGKVISVDAGKRKAEIEHDEIPGYMRAMKMNFPIKQEWVFSELKPGHRINAEMVVEPNGDYWLENVSIFSSVDAMRDVSASPNEAASDKIGTEVPDFKLTNQEGKRINFKDFRGKNLVVTFIFTRCPDPDMCPLMSINFSDLEKMLRKSPALAENTRLLSVTFDPEYDKPEVLRKYGEAYQGKDIKPNFDIWQLATGSEQEINEILQYFGVFAQKDDGSRIIHNLRTVIISPDGKVQKIYSGNNWKNADILRDLQATSANKQS